MARKASPDAVRMAVIMIIRKESGMSDIVGGGMSRKGK
jgi:hypothetical protein